MTDAAPNADQREAWNTNAGDVWVQQDAELEHVHGALTPRLLALAAPKPTDHILDIGCGSGAVTRAFAEAAPQGSATGLDISAPLLALARQHHGDHAQFVEGDAQTHAFAPESADLIVSRFGVMFFADPVAAFANIASALRPGGRLCMGCWGPMPRNPWFDGPRQVIEALYGPQPRPEPRAPGPMAFSDTGYVTDILTQAGFANARVQTEDLTFTHPGGAAKAAEVISKVGPPARIVRENGGGEAEMQVLRDRLHQVFAGYEGADGFALPAHIHFYMAEKPS